MIMQREGRSNSPRTGHLTILVRVTGSSFAPVWGYIEIFNAEIILDSFIEFVESTIRAQRKRITIRFVIVLER